MKKLMALLMTVVFLGSTGLALASGPTGKREHKPRHHKGRKKNPPASPKVGMENRVNN
jgi:hypothetical protein